MELPRITLAADARFSRIDYTDDQIWDLVPGKLDSPALVLQTRYGGRVGVASLVPMWTLVNDRRTIYQPQAYSTPPKVVQIAPGFARVEASITPQIKLTAEYWVMESHAIGGRYTLTNTGTQAASLRLDLFAQIGSEGKTLKLAIVTLTNGLNALSFGTISNIAPIVMLEKANAQITPGKTASPKIGTDLNIAAGEGVSIRWVHAAANDLRDSLALGEAWLNQDWQPHFARIEQEADAIPTIQTGNPDFDQTIAYSYQQLLQSMMKGGGLPHPSFVASRQPSDGFSPNGEGTDHERAWSGQSANLAYLVAPALATIDPTLVKGIIRNFIAVQDANGAIDGKPGLAGQRQGSLAMPLLARLTLELYRLTQDAEFVHEVLPALQNFYRHWFTQDVDGDTLPEWLNERQSGFVYFPTFGTNNQWAQNGDIRYVESPDLAAYFVSEYESLQELGEAVGVTTELQTTGLAELWHEGRYAYRDRDTHIIGTAATMLIEDARADESLVLSEDFTLPTRVLIRITGGTGKPPKITLTVHGTGITGVPVHETATFKEIGWYRGYGVYVTANAFNFLDRIEIEGLSRVYRVDVQTVDLSRLDINAVLPLWTNAHDPALLVSLITDPAHFSLPNGIPMTAASDPAFNPAENGGIWLFSLTLIVEGLLKHGFTQEASDLLRRIMTAQAGVLKQDGHFHEFYHSQEAKGSGDTGNLAGIVPLHVLNKLMGIFILSPSEVRAGGVFAWGSPVTVRQHGVQVTRSADGTKIVFPSGHTIELPGDAPLQRVSDTQAAAPVTLIETTMPEYPAGVQQNTGKVVIQVQVEPNVTKPKPESDENSA
jgi:hypothetical protein